MSNYEKLQKENEYLWEKLNEMKKLKRYPVMLACPPSEAGLMVVVIDGRFRDLVLSHGMSVIFVQKGK